MSQVGNQEEFLGGKDWVGYKEKLQGWPESKSYIHSQANSAQHVKTWLCFSLYFSCGFPLEERQTLATKQGPGPSCPVVVWLANMTLERQFGI